MSLLSDILSGRLFNFKTAQGSDIDAGTSNKLLTTPLSLATSSLCFRQTGSASAGDPVVVGSSNKLMKSEVRGTAFNKDLGTTGGTVMEGNEVTAFVPFTIGSQLSMNVNTFSPGTDRQIIPPNNYCYAGRAATFLATLYADVKVDSGAIGEIALYDVAASAVVAGSTFAFNGTGFSIQHSNEFFLTPGKLYTYAIRKVSGAALSVIYIDAALLTFKMPKGL